LRQSGRGGQQESKNRVWTSSNHDDLRRNDYIVPPKSLGPRVSRRARAPSKRPERSNTLAQRSYPDGVIISGSHLPQAHRRIEAPPPTVIGRPGHDVGYMWAAGGSIARRQNHVADVAAGLDRFARAALPALPAAGHSCSCRSGTAATRPALCKAYPTMAL
jgi:hypothetical protein